MANVEIELNVTSGVEEKTQNIKLGKSFIKNLESLSQTTDRPNEIFYGVLQSSGSVEIVDRNKNILNAINNGEISNSSLPISIYANGKQVQRHVVKDSSYDTTTNTLTMELTNSLEEWSNIKYGGYSYPETEKPAYDLLVDCLSILYDNEQIDKMLDTIIVYGTNNEEGSVKDYLQRIIIQYPYLESATVLDTVNKFCTLAQLQVYQNDDGEIKFVSARPIATSSEIENPIAIPQNRQISQFAETKLLKNKYKSMELSENKPTIEVNDKDSVASFDSMDNNYTITKETAKGDSVQGILRVLSKIKVTYYNLSITIPKNNNYNLKKVLNILTGVDNDGRPIISHSVEYTEQKGNITSIGENGFDDIYYVTITEKSEKTGEIAKYEEGFTFDFVNNIEGSVSIEDLTNLKIASVTFNDNGDFVLNLKIAVGLDRDIAFVLDSNPSILEPNLPSQSVTYIPKKLTVTVYGKTREISFEDVTLSIYDNNNIDIITIDGNELLQSGTKYALTKMSDVIIDNIKNDYQIGIEDASTKVVCDNYEYTNGIIAKNWLNGELIKPLDIVRVDKDNLGNSISSYKDGTPRIWKVTERNFNKTGVPLCDLKLQELYTKPRQSLFTTMSWEEINNIAQSGYANLYFRVGDTREITFNDGKKGKLVILGFDHDDLSDGSGKAKMTLGLANLVPNTLMVMNETDTNAGGWASSYMRNTNMNTIMNLLPEELSSIIKSVDKKSLSGEGSKETTTTSDKLWLFSRVEIEGIFDDYYSDYYSTEGTQYTYWKTIRNGKDGRDRLKSIIETDTMAWYDWWLRTAHATRNFSTFHCYSAPHGIVVVNYGATTELGVCFGFCI